VQRSRAQRDDELATLLVDQQHLIGIEVEGFFFNPMRAAPLFSARKVSPTLSLRASVLSTSNAEQPRAKQFRAIRKYT